MKGQTFMKTLKQLAVINIVGILCAPGIASAQDSNTQTQVSLVPYYRSQEFSIDAFASGSVNQETIDHISGKRIRHNTQGGAGAGFNYFFTRYVGLGGDAYSENTTGGFIDNASGNLILRLPIGETGLAPYIFGGGGYHFEEIKQSFGQAGGGLEFRFTQHVGLFVDARYVLADQTENYGLGRAGLRFSF